MLQLYTAACDHTIDYSCFGNVSVCSKLGNINNSYSRSNLELLIVKT
jgi:hypothetical protein